MSNDVTRERWRLIDAHACSGGRRHYVYARDGRWDVRSLFADQFSSPVGPTKEGKQ